MSFRPQHRWRRPLRRGWDRVLLVLLASLGSAGLSAEWHVANAPLRFTLRLTRPPSHTEAGYVAFLPDGGILPTPHPLPTVVASDGTRRQGAVLWHNPEKGLCLVFEDTGLRGPVHIYVSPAQRLNIWSPESALKPSPLLITDPDRGTLAAARQLARFGPAGPRTHVHPATGHRRAPLSIPGDVTGRPRPAAFYLLAFLDLKQSGDTWFAPFSHVGESEVQVNGTRLVPRLRDDKWGGTGQSLPLQQGLHRLEAFVGVPGSGNFTEGQGILWMTWQTPSDTPDDLGGLRPDGVPHAGTSAWSSRVVRENEIVRSGQCALTGFRTQSGNPLAVASVKAEENYWMEGGNPVFLYALRAVAGDNPNETQYHWTFDRTTTTTGSSILWLFPGSREQQVVLTSESNNHRSRVTIPFFSHAGIQTRLDDPAARDRFQQAFLTMLEAAPASSDPTRSWTADMWRCFFDVQSLGEGGELLSAIVLRHGDALRRNFNAEEQSRIETLFFHHMAHHDPPSALAWLDRALVRADTRERRIDLRGKAADVLLFQRADHAGAAQRLRSLVTEFNDPAARVRLGDLAFLQGDRNRAEELWGSVQSATRSPTIRTPDDGRRAAILETRYSMTVAAFIDQRRWEDALHELQQWERYYPLSKISGDWIRQHARLFAALGNDRRARGMLEAYCRQVEASSDLADSAELLLDILLRDPDSDDAIRELSESMQERFRFHPVRQRMADVLMDIDGARRQRRERP